MTTIDETTGLPELPEGLVWKVMKETYRVDFIMEWTWGRKLSVAIADTSIGFNGVRYASSIPSTAVLAYASTSSIRRAAAKSLRKFNKSQAKKTRESGLNEFVGTYPPKKLGA